MVNIHFSIFSHLANKWHIFNSRSSGSCNCSTSSYISGINKFYNLESVCLVYLNTPEFLCRLSDSHNDDILISKRELFSFVVLVLFCLFCFFFFLIFIFAHAIVDPLPVSILAC